VLDVSMAEPVLQAASVVTGVGKGVAANMVKHVCAEKSDHLSLEELSRADTDASRD
jgi:hypothetical protein